MSPNNFDDPTPTVADEVSAVVDDAEVISKTLPSTRRSAWLTDQACHVLSVTRGHVVEHPAQAVLIAAVGGAALSALIAWMHEDRSSGDRRQRQGRTGA